MRIVFIRDRLIKDGHQNTPQETRYRAEQVLDCSDESARYFVGNGDAVELTEQPDSPERIESASLDSSVSSTSPEEETFTLRKKK